MKTIALVGGIGSGKSTIAHMFAELGAGIINLDDVGPFRAYDSWRKVRHCAHVRRECIR